MSGDLISAYRPMALDDVVGQDPVVSSLRSVLKEGGSHSFLFVGPSGTGKTTLARIIARMKKLEVREIDAATNTGVDAMRALKDSLRFSTIGGKKAGRLVIVDECHSLSKQAWQSLLKDVEEPPKGIWWAFCTTEGTKVPKTIETRCATYKLQPVDDDDLYELVKGVNANEALSVSDKVLGMIARKAQGSPRAALVALAKVQGIKDPNDAADVLEAIQDESKEVIELCRLLAKGGTWAQAMKIVSKLPAGSTEGIRRQIQAYFVKVAMGSKQVPHSALAVLSAFGDVYMEEGRGPLLLSLGELYMDEE